MTNWPELPVNSIINWLSSKSSSLVVADFGCGENIISYPLCFAFSEVAFTWFINLFTFYFIFGLSGDARIAKSVKNKVFSFDLVSKDPSVIACDMSNVRSNPFILFFLQSRL